MFKQFLPFLLLLNGCTPTPQISESINFDYDKVENIEFKLQTLPDNKGDLSDYEWTKTVAMKISGRFAKAGYPISSTFDKTTKGITHTMEANVEETRITKTQPGLTFDFGNSNPRSSNYQKTLSAPINCVIQSLEDPEQNVSLKELKSVSNPFDQIGLSQQQKNDKLKHFYIENIGSTCHNLLKKLSVKSKAIPRADPLDSEAFTPAIRIETKYKSDNKQKLKDTTANTSKEE